MRFEGYCAAVEVLHRTSKWGEVRRLACPLRRFPFAAPPNCGRKGGTQYQREMVETSDSQTIRLQTGSAPWNVYSTYDRNLVQGDFSTPLRFARNDVAREVSTVRYPLSAYREGKDGFENWNLGSVVPL